MSVNTANDNKREGVDVDNKRLDAKHVKLDVNNARLDQEWNLHFVTFGETYRGLPHAQLIRSIIVKIFNTTSALLTLKKYKYKHKYKYKYKYEYKYKYLNTREVGRTRE